MSEPNNAIIPRLMEECLNQHDGGIGLAGPQPLACGLSQSDSTAEIFQRKKRL